MQFNAEGSNRIAGLHDNHERESEPERRTLGYLGDNLVQHEVKNE